MTISSFVYAMDFTATDPTSYKTAIDGNFLVAQQLVAQFSPYVISSAPDMTVRVSSGSIYISSGPTLDEIAAQTSTTIAAPSSNPRIDRAIISMAAGVLAIVTGTPSTAPTPPAITSSYLPICQIYLTSTMTSITNADITDERTLYVF